MDLTQPFRGSAAIAAGLLTPGVLRGPRFRRLFPDIYVPADAEVDLELLSRAAYLLVAGRGALAGHSAAELLGAGCAPLGAPAEVVSPHRVRPHRGLVVRQDQIPSDELQELDGLVVTTPQRTAYDLGRRTPLVEAVVAVDAPAPRPPLRHPRRADPRQAAPRSPRERAAAAGGGALRPPRRLAVEYNGRDHLDPDRALRDLERAAYLTAAGWTVLRFGAYLVLQRPDVVAARVRARLVTAARAAGLPLEALAAA